nr:50S ribosomal protein L11 methyltransferase [Rhizobium halophytocola]
MRLYRATPTSRLSRLVGDAAPYWAHAWGGGLALARHFVEHPDCVAGRSLIDLGTGGGLVALIAKRLGASDVRGVDLDPWAITAARLNAKANELDVGFSVAHAAQINVDAEVVTAGDLFYEQALADEILPALKALAAAGATVLIGDPGRRTLPVDALEAVAHYPVGDFAHAPGAAPATGTVYRLRDGA